ncbi:hypothetical protein CXB51_017470 [Gossypium anomalum]|uniref:Uncharacterized protein n=1 Tax=Gossypium anomalum TaxID=47600 RepID=A0A8J5YUT3_9ROSI|nr:hypothetical protein CXB51_017470 [Gossypium anomalum]
MNFSYAQNQRSNQSYQPRTPLPQPYQLPKSSLESLVERLAQSQENFEDRTESHLQEIDKQISQLAKTVGRLESQGKLPSKIEANPWENVSAITLRSGTIVEQQMTPIREKNDAETSKNNKAIVKKSTSTEEANDANPQEENEATTRRKIKNPISKPAPSPYATQPPFPSGFIKKDKQAVEKEILDVF